MQINPLNEDYSYKDLTDVTETNVAAGTTYLGKNLFTIPSTAKRVYVSANVSGNAGGWFEAYRGLGIITFDLGNVGFASLTWAGNNIGVSYVTNNGGYARDFIFHCKYSE